MSLNNLGKSLYRRANVYAFLNSETKTLVR